MAHAWENSSDLIVAQGGPKHASWTLGSTTVPDTSRPQRLLSPAHSTGFQDLSGLHEGPGTRQGDANEGRLEAEREDRGGQPEPDAPWNREPGPESLEPAQRR